MRTWCYLPGTMPYTVPCPFTVDRYVPGSIWWAVALRSRGIRGARDTMGILSWALARLKSIKVMLLGWRVVTRRPQGP